MKQLPESILYGTRFVFVVAITFMTPFCTLVADALAQKLTNINGHTIILLIFDLILFSEGWNLLILNHKYIVEKEKEYGINI